MSTHKVKFGRDVAIAGAATLLKSLRNVFLLLLLTRELTQASYGLWEEFGAGIALLLPWATLQLPGALVRFLAGVEDHRQVREGFYSILCFVCLWSCALSLFVWVVLPHIEQLASSPFAEHAPYVLSLLPITAANNSVISYFRTFRQMVRHSLLNLAQHFGEIALIAYALRADFGLTGALGALALIRAGIMLIGLAMVVAQIGIALPRFGQLGAFLRFSLPTVPNSSFYRIFDTADRFFIASFISHAAVSIYAAAYTAGGLLSTLVAPLHLVLLPLMSELWNQNRREELSDYITLTIRYSSMFTIPSLAGIALLADPILGLLVPASYAESARYFPVLAFSFLLFGMGVFASHLLLTAGHTRFIMAVVGSLALLNAALNFLLVPTIGIWGAVLATLVSHLFYTWMTFARSRRIVPFRFPWRELGQYAAASALMAGTVQLSRSLFDAPLPVNIAVGAVSYLALLWLMRALSMKEVRFICQLLQQRGPAPDP